MTLRVKLLAAGGQEELHYEENPFAINGPVLITMTPAQVHGHFNSGTLEDAGTIILVEPKPGRSIAISDIIVSGEKQPNSTVLVQFTDGVNTKIIFLASQVDAPPVGPGPLNSYFHGWKDARVEMITSGTGDATVTIGYLHSNELKPFAEWDAER